MAGPQPRQAVPGGSGGDPGGSADGGDGAGAIVRQPRRVRCGRAAVPTGTPSSTGADAGEIAAVQRSYGLTTHHVNHEQGGDRAMTEWEASGGWP